VLAALSAASRSLPRHPRIGRSALRRGVDPRGEPLACRAGRAGGFGRKSIRCSTTGSATGSPRYGIGQEPAQAAVFIWLGGSNVTSLWLTWQFGVLNSTPRAVVLPWPFTTPL
jgi:hypothetical protein